MTTNNTQSPSSLSSRSPLSSDNIYLKRLTCSWRNSNPYSHEPSYIFGQNTDSTAAPALSNIPDPRSSATFQQQQQQQMTRPRMQQISFEKTVDIRRRFINPSFEISNDGLPSRLIVHEDIRTCGVYLTGFTLRKSNCGRRMSSPELMRVIAPVMGKLDVSDLAFGCSVFQSSFQSGFYSPRVVRASEKMPQRVFRVFNEGWFCLITLLPHAKCGLRDVQKALNNFVWNDTVIQSRCCPLGILLSLYF